MNIYEALKNEHIRTRKEKLPTAGFVGYIISEIQNKAVDIVDGQKVYTDAKAIPVLQNLKKKLAESPAGPATDEEISILNRYLPKQLTEDELRVILREHCLDMNMGERMNYMKTNYVGQYDGKVAAQIAKEI